MYILYIITNSKVTKNMMNRRSVQNESKTLKSNNTTNNSKTDKNLITSGETRNQTLGWLRSDWRDGWGREVEVKYDMFKSVLPSIPNGSKTKFL